MKIKINWRKHKRPFKRVCVDRPGGLSAETQRRLLRHQIRETTGA